jgi:hypothetical protein
MPVLRRFFFACFNLGGGRIGNHKDATSVDASSMLNVQPHSAMIVDRNLDETETETETNLLLST